MNAVTAADRALVATAALPHTTLGGTLADWMMARDESIRSSVMEGVAATEPGLEWALYLSRAGRPVDDENDALTLGAAKQVAAAVELGQKMRAGSMSTLEDIVDVHGCLFAETREHDVGGVFRDEPIWIGPPGCLVDDASFVPAPAEHVPELMSDLVDYLNTSDHPAVLRAAVIHAQFETIHPFEDGNGRTGRALVHTVLVAAGVTRAAVPISAALSHDRSGYYDALNATRVVCESHDTAARSFAIHDWLRVFSNSCEQANRQAASVTQTVEGMIARWQQAATFRRDSTAAILLEALPSMPVLDARMASQRLGMTERAARAALTSLDAAGIVSPTGGRRNRRYTVPDMVGMLRRMTPDGGLPHHRGTALSAPSPSPQTPPAHTACGYLGPRSNKRCRLPKGHIGQHRYPPR
ncbi:Fic family protein [Candidatus Poriferisodalis sp.]|uniref:Fic family protein n=1 Tax=Candidatus Poriferisodalis sp. TaxID=3101277 RepID=UPI003B526FFE